LRVTFLSVGEGDAAVIRFPGSRVMLVDAGGAFRGTFDPGERIVAPYLWSLKIMHVGYLVLSHPDRDHFGGFDFIARSFSPTRFWSSYARSADISYGKLMATLEKVRVRMRVIDASMPPITIGGVQVECLGPSPAAVETGNNLSMVMRFGFGPTVLLFTGDLEAAGERELVAQASAGDLRATVLKVPHHGSKTSSTDVFINAVHPEVAVISLGYHNRFNFPAKSVVDRYRVAGAQVLRTDEVGAVTVDAGSQRAAMWTWRTGALRLDAAAH
jgi:competence protein ComEC